VERRWWLCKAQKLTALNLETLKAGCEAYFRRQLILRRKVSVCVCVCVCD